MKTIKLSAFLAGFGAVLAGLLAGVYALTIDKINENNLKSTQSDLFVAYSEGESFCNLTDDSAEDACEDTNADLLTGSIVAIYAVLDGSDERIGVVYQTDASNSFGNVAILTAFNEEGELFGWVASETSSQTPGYGADLLKNGLFKKYVIEGTNSDVAGGVSGTKGTVDAGINEVKSHFSLNKEDLL